jgi:hypothetical protein
MPRDWSFGLTLNNASIIRVSKAECEVIVKEICDVDIEKCRMHMNWVIDAERTSWR